MSSPNYKDEEASNHKALDNQFIKSGNSDGDYTYKPEEMELMMTFAVGPFCTLLMTLILTMSSVVLFSVRS